MSSKNEILVVPRHCQLCQMPETLAKVLVETPYLWSLCDICIQQFNDSLAGELHELHVQKSELSYTPSDIVDYFNKYIVGQNDAKKTLALAAYQHYKKQSAKKNVKFSKSNVLLLGPTGSGKTALIEHLAAFLGVPFVVYDATQLTETGYVGDDVPDIIAALYRAAGEDLGAAQKGIICLDEIDKVNMRSDSGKDIGGASVQRMLLKTLESNKVQFTKAGARRGGGDDPIEFDTSNVLFICSGAFSTLPEIIMRRANKDHTGIGFAAKVHAPTDKATFSEAIDHLDTDDLVSYGFMPEFIGRFTQISHTDTITPAIMRKILLEPVNSAFKQVVSLLKLDKVDLIMTDAALDEVALKASKHKTGARALPGILSHVLKDAMFEYPSNHNIIEVHVDFIDGKFDITYEKEAGDYNEKANDSSNN